MSNIQPEYSNADHGKWNGYRFIARKYYWCDKNRVSLEVIK